MDGTEVPLFSEFSCPIKGLFDAKYLMDVNGKWEKMVYVTVPNF